MPVFETRDTDDISFTETLCWSMLSEAVDDRRHPMHLVVVATPAGHLAHMRTVVLRRVDTDTHKLYFHTDIRSGKIEEIRATGHLSWLAYGASLRSQLRLSGPTVLHNQDELCRLHWDRTRLFSKRCYLLPEPPGQELKGSVADFDERLAGFQYTLEESEAGFERFVVVETQVDSMEWYYTHNRGNRRAHFSYRDGALHEACWLTP
jgi:hypothetical protein